MIFLLLFIQVSSSTFFFGVFILLFCFLVALFLSIFNLLWYSFLFFLIYVGGVLVLFFYILSLNSNPNMGLNLSFFNPYILFFLFFFFILMCFQLNIFSFFGYIVSSLEENSYLLFQSSNVYFIILLGFYLIFILFLVSIISSSVKGALRPIGIVI
uniref:NADH dehydrogenase subunit 6 n=1 Tax=Parakontikia atrata TaxID=2903269 RepID=A0A9E7V821_9PLAT|nr:NADH dehydrogenase subunit 6 [Parakontikia atrata]UZA66410.1 NADH dehydrogenase subunit 6 [Parakontikia atrata]